LFLGGILSGNGHAAERQQAANGGSNSDGLQVHETPPELLSFEMNDQPGIQTRPGGTLFRAPAARRSPSGAACSSHGIRTATVCLSATVLTSGQSKNDRRRPAC